MRHSGQGLIKGRGIGLVDQRQVDVGVQKPTWDTEAFGIGPVDPFDKFVKGDFVAVTEKKGDGFGEVAFLPILDVTNDVGFVDKCSILSSKESINKFDFFFIKL